MGVLKCEDRDCKRKFGSQIFHIWGEADILEQAESTAAKLKSEGYLVRLVALGRSGAYRIWILEKVLISKEAFEYWCSLKDRGRFKIIEDAYNEKGKFNTP